MALRLFLVAALLVVCTTAFQTSSQCGQTLENLGVSGLRPILVPCLGGSTEGCCNSLNLFAGWIPEAVAGGCFCKPLVIERLKNRLRLNDLAKSLGFGPEVFDTRLKECGIPHFGGTGCGDEDASSAPAPTDQDGGDGR